MDSKTEAERRHIARLELAQKLGSVLQHALGAGLSSEAAIIAKIIEAILTNTATDMLLQLHDK